MADRYKQSPEELYYEFSSSATGLTSAQVNENIEKYGRNVIAQGKKKSAVQIRLWILYAKTES